MATWLYAFVKTDKNTAQKNVFASMLIFEKKNQLGCERKDGM